MRVDRRSFRISCARVLPGAGPMLDCAAFIRRGQAVCWIGLAIVLGCAQESKAGCSHPASRTKENARLFLDAAILASDLFSGPTQGQDSSPCARGACRPTLPIAPPVSRVVNSSRPDPYQNHEIVQPSSPAPHLIQPQAALLEHSPPLPACLLRPPRHPRFR